MKINKFKSIVLALSLSLVFTACDNNKTNEPAKETEQKAEVDHKNQADSSTTESKEKESEKKEDDESNKDDNKNESNSSLKDGTYKASANGYDRELNLEVTIADGKISDIELLENHESDAVINRAFPIIKERIIEANSPDVDSVSAATYSTTAIKQATLAALEEAGLEKDSIKVSNSTGYEEDRELTEAEDKTTDLLVIGAGPAGLASAIQAKQDGVDKVTVIEKMDILSGNGKFDMNFFDMANSEAMKANNNEVSKDEYKEKYKEKSWDSEDRIDAVTEGAFEVDSWLRDQGIDLDYNFGEDGSMNHMAKEDEYAGDYIQTKLEAIAKDLGVEIIPGTKATDLVIEDGKATGAAVEDKENTYKINATSTVIATGGFANNPELLAEYIPGAEEIPTSNQIGATGDFVEIAKNHNIKLGDMEKPSVFPKILDPRRDLTGAFDSNFIFVNENGERFIDETSGDIEYGQEMMKNRPVYYIFDETAKDSFYRLSNQVEKGYIDEYDSVEKLAEAIGCEADTLNETIDTYNKAVKGEADDPFREEAAEAEINKDGKLYCVKVTPALHMTKGGIVANGKAQVLDNEDNIIEGLYAAGEVTDTSGAYSSAVIFGRISGKSAAENINK
ncbi:FAD-binding protein [Anaerococcus sp. mt242]|uniref:FAD-binding protein n=1 Tax=Anaerococcus sp. mt242 TaxID=2661917 RepID=UPI0019324E90|nr:FAD-binding protein [Anaerococcus sp. mt242]MBM0046451.1 FAD-binding protein [Anaerococcus sp. mt242]